MLLYIGKRLPDCLSEDGTIAFAGLQQKPFYIKFGLAFFARAYENFFPTIIHRDLVIGSIGFITARWSDNWLIPAVY